MRRGLFGRLGKLGLNRMIQPNVSPPPVYLTQWKIVGNSEVKTLPYPDGVVLPTGYKRCEYIQSDKAYIELPFGFDKTDEFYAKVKFNAKYTSERHIISTKQWNTDNNRFCFGVEASSFAVALGNITTANGKFTPNAPSNLSVCEVSYSNKQYTLLNNGDTFVCDLSNATFGSETAHICLLKNYNDSGTNGAIYEYRHKRGNTEYRFIPCLDDNDIPCIYDVINNQAYYNSAGSGSFTYKLYPQPTEIWSCGEYNLIDGKWHILVQPQGGSITDIALTEPLRKAGDNADTIEFPAALEAFCNKDGSQIQTTIPDDTILHIRQIIKNGDFSNGTTSWKNALNVDVSVSNNKLHIVSNTGGTGNNYSWAGINTNMNTVTFVGQNVYVHYTANPSRNMDIGLDGTGGGVYSQECISNTNNEISCIKTLTMVNQWYFGFNKGMHEVDDEVIISNAYSFDLDAMFADCPSLKPSTASEFEALFTNIDYIDYSDTAIDVIVKEGKLYKYVDIEGKALVTRNLKSLVNIKNLSWARQQVRDGTYRYRVIINDMKPHTGGNRTPNMLCAIYSTITPNQTYLSVDGMSADSSQNLLLYDSNYNTADSLDAFKEHINGVELIYELATPTTELVDVSQIEEAESYSCVITPGGKAVSWSDFETE